jgi:hypothetical protein
VPIGVGATPVRRLKNTILFPIAFPVKNFHLNKFPPFSRLSNPDAGLKNVGTIGTTSPEAAVAASPDFFDSSRLSASFRLKKPTQASSSNEKKTKVMQESSQISAQKNYNKKGMEMAWKWN